MLASSAKSNASGSVSLKIQEVLTASEKIILGKSKQVKLALCALLADGHLLVEDVPGVGKTTLVQFLVQATGLKSLRIQFTNDLLPADILGTSVFDSRTSSFSFHTGPIFTQIVIADELNRATPKTQSATLQAMEERMVSVDGKTYPLPKPFFLVATQNPREQAGTYGLPESQLDRFLLRIEMGYPDRNSERDLLRGESRAVLVSNMSPILDAETILTAQDEVSRVFVSEPILDYVQDLLDYSRNQGGELWGLSPRAGLALLKAARAWAYLEGRNMVLPDDVQSVGVAVMGHRLNRSEEFDSKRGHRLAEKILSEVPVK
ncbi:MAG: MoxR family ATPase [Bdellovibrionales bacterium]|nr:MoxR family ATPase [Bdellovibrionales bacterium]